MGESWEDRRIEDEIIDRLLRSLDSELDTYHQMYGTEVKHKNSGFRAKIVQRPNEERFAGVHNTAVFIKESDGTVSSFDPGFFIKTFDIIESKSLAQAMRGILEPELDVESTLDRFDAIENLNYNKGRNPWK